MSENTDYTAPQEVNTFVEVKPTYEALELMTQQLSNRIEQLESYQTDYGILKERINKVGKYVKDNLDEDWRDYAKEVLEILHLPTTTTKRFKVTVTAVIDVEGEIDKDFDNLSDYDFDVDSLDISSNEKGFTVTSTDDIEMTEIEDY